MNRSRIFRILGLTAAAALTLAALGIGPVAAKTPSGWDINADRLPTTVKAGNDAGYAVTITNVGPSNINNVTASIVTLDDEGAEPTYFADFARNQGDPSSCTEDGPLVCSLGTLTPDTVITFTVAYNVPAGTTGSFDLSLRLRAGTGDVPGKNQSRGDAFEKPVKTGINNDQNFDGGFAVDDFSYATGGSLGRNNKQTSQVDITDDAITVNIQDGIPDNQVTCEIDACAHLIGDWASLTVPNNTDMIKVTLMIWGNSVPGPVGADDIYLLHSDGNGGFDAIGDDDDEICADANTPPSSGECIKVTKVGNNYRLVAWLAHNGALRGTW